MEIVPNEKQEMVTIGKAELNYLQRRSEILRHLENAGVDNWEWYGDAIAAFNEESENESR